MIAYTIDCYDTEHHILHVQMDVPAVDTPVVDLQLPAWRPGRYELANYARNSMYLHAYDAQQQPVYVEKVSRERWRIHANGHTSLTIRYGYYAQQMDAGGSWLDASQVYINFVNCLMYIEGRIDEACQVQLLMPETYQVACGLSAIGTHTLQAADFYELADCPLMASETLLCYSYSVAKTVFHIWIQGDTSALYPLELVNDFRNFTEVQIQMMGEFPVPVYHFLLHLLPYAHYHGVEHRNSTVMTLGPAAQVGTELYADLMGLSSHELFHTWNICKIRPAELLPYDFTRENYFTTGYIAEGVTTYYGDLFLARSGFFDEAAYFAELSCTLNRHFMQSNTARQSLLQSSFDLWIDGYTAGVPNRKVSIYHKGALAALILDLEIRHLTQQQRSLDDVIRGLWEQFGKTGIGYTHADYVALVESVAGQPMQSYFESCIEGTVPLQMYLSNLLQTVGCQAHIQPIEGKMGCVQVDIMASLAQASVKRWPSKP